MSAPRRCFRSSWASSRPRSSFRPETTGSTTGAAARCWASTSRSSTSATDSASCSAAAPSTPRARTIAASTAFAWRRNGPRRNSSRAWSGNGRCRRSAAPRTAASRRRAGRRTGGLRTSRAPPSACARSRPRIPSFRTTTRPAARAPGSPARTGSAKGRSKSGSCRSAANSTCTSPFRPTTSGCASNSRSPVARRCVAVCLARSRAFSRRAAFRPCPISAPSIRFSSRSATDCSSRALIPSRFSAARWSCRRAFGPALSAPACGPMRRGSRRPTCWRRICVRAPTASSRGRRRFRATNRASRSRCGATPSATPRFPRRGWTLTRARRSCSRSRRPARSKWSPARATRGCCRASCWATPERSTRSIPRISRPARRRRRPTACSSTPTRSLRTGWRASGNGRSASARRFRDVRFGLPCGFPRRCAALPPPRVSSAPPATRSS